MPNNVAVEFTIGQRQAVETAFTINASPTKVSQLENDLDFQTKDEVDTALEAKQDVLTAGEGITIEDNVISATGATITIDDELSTTSENPVQNKVVTSAINQNHTEIGNIGQTIGTYGNIVTHDADEFATSAQGALADTAVQPSDLATVATTGSYDDLIDKPTIPAAQVNSDWNADSGVAQILNKPSLATVATSGAYSDLTGTPTIPTVNDATLTIQKNGVDVQTFTANASTNATANITVPTDTGDLTNGAGFITSSALTNYVTTNTAQTISANKTFHNAELITDNMITLNGSTSLLRGLKGIEYRNLIKLNSSGITAGSINEVLTLNGSGTRPKYNSSDVALYSDIPTVNDGKLALQVNSTDVGEFTANQSSDTTINISVPTDTADLTNGAGFITSASLPTNYVTTNTAQDISAQKTFLGEKAILFKQTATTDKLGFTLYNTSNTELGAFEWRPDTISGGALLNLNMSYSSSNYLGFRYWGTAVNIIAPKVATAGNYYIPVNVTNGNTTVTATSAGTVNISSLLPTVNNATITITQGGVTKGSFSLNQASGDTIALDAGGGGGGGSYTAGDGIDITNDVISVDAESTNEVDVESITEVTISDLLKLITGYDANATQTLKNINGSIQWVTD